MTNKINTAIFILGLVYLTFSEFFYVQIDEFSLIWLAAAVITAISFIVLLVQIEGWKKKSIWIGVFLSSVLIFLLTQEFQFNTSCELYLKTNEEVLEDLVAELNKDSADYHLGAKNTDTINYTPKDFRIRGYLRSADAIYVIKGKNDDGYCEIYLELWGFLDARFGLVYSPEGVPIRAGKPLKHVDGHWYR
ncbi:MAG: hypothetical protein L6Q81_15860 [Bacteroidia bacterium]|nr:hypothetical protein [Bacteroidia bacterium]